MHKTIVFFVVIATLWGLGCQTAKETDWSLSLSKKSKTPYGTYLGYQSLQLHFSGLKITDLPANYVFTNLSTLGAPRTKKVLVLSGLYFGVNEKEWAALRDFVSDGNEIVLFCNQADLKILSLLNLQIVHPAPSVTSETLPDAGNTSNISLVSLPSLHFSYNGRSISSYFRQQPNELDSNRAINNTTAHKQIQFITDTLGFTDAHANFVKVAIGEGHLTIHVAPMVLSNYFLKQGNNILYLDGVWRTLPEQINALYWGDFQNRFGQSSSSDLLLQNPSVRNAIYLALIAAALYVLFQSKRRQRIIPVMDTPKNETVSFVETVGQLYYNRGNNRNLAEKMVQHFLEWVRLQYNIKTNVLDDSFAMQLGKKTGLGLAKAQKIVNMMQEIQALPQQATYNDLAQLYHTIQEFYKHKTDGLYTTK